MKRPLLFALGGLCIQYAQADTPWTMTWSDASYGPDGPWNAISVKIGSNYQSVALYPGASWSSEILLTTICENTTDFSPYCFADTAGLFDADKSTTYDNESIGLSPNGDWSTLNFGYTSAVPITADAHRALDTIDIGGQNVPTVDLIAIKQGYQTYPGNKIYPLQVGTLSLGCTDINQTFSVPDKAPINGTFITSWLYEKGVISSYSYGLHIGSPTLNIPGSLILGGYDQNRVIGNISAQTVSGGQLPIRLTDISLGVADGGSPWNSSSVTGLLAASNSTLNSGLTIAADPTNPYIYLPQSSCNAIAAWLPVTYNSDLGLYFWDTSSSEYQTIVTSPSYLAFTFEKNGVNTETISIKVPFALLNLTLENPLVTEPTQYFPCMGTDSDPVLGRAFLQAAFVGVQWSESSWFLAQGPGPSNSFISDVITIGESAKTISESGNSWEGTWSNYWKPLSATNSSSTTNSTSTTVSTSSTASTGGSGGLSTGSKAGIGIGCGAGAVAIISAVCWFFFRRRQKKNNPEGPMAEVPANPRLTSQPFPAEMADRKPTTVHELDYDRSRAFQGSSTTNNISDSTQGWYQAASKQGSEQRSQASYRSSQPTSGPASPPAYGPYELSSR